MKPLIIFYSHSGNNEKLAMKLKERIGCEIYRITETKKRKTISILLDFLLNRKSALPAANVALNEYDKIIFIAPVWGGRIASPIKAFLEREKINLKKCYYITLCSGEPGQKEKITAELKAILQCDPEHIKELWINSLLPEENRNKVKYTFNYRISERDLELFDKDIESFIQLVNA